MEFKRINFFKGFFTHAEDWQAAEAYHLEKRKLHNQCFHTPGVIIDHLNDFAVEASESGTSITVLPGYAIDGEGRDVYLTEPVSLKFNPFDYNPPTTLYVAARYHEEKSDRRENVTNPEYSGYAFIQEYAQVELTTDEPDNKEQIELARITLREGKNKIFDAKDSANPKANEIDRRFISIAGAARAAPAARTQVRFEDIANIRRTGGDLNVVPNQDAVVLFDKVAKSKPQHFYLTNVYPTEAAGISWRIETKFEKSMVEYRLFITNLSKQSVSVRWEVLIIG